MDAQVALADGHADLVRHLVVRAGTTSSLTTREAELLEYLAARPNQDVPRDELLERVWNYKASFQTRAVDVTVRRLREKIEADPAHPVLVVTVTNVGYRFVPAATTTPAPAQDAVALPLEATSFVGRDAELVLLDEAVAAAPLVTIVGPPGVGKTRIALHWARTRGDRFTAVVWCDLAGSRSLGQALVVLADALGIPVPDGASTDVQVDRLARAAASRGACLVVLDNLEQLADAPAWLARWLRSPGPVRLLATSQVRPGVGEALVDLGPLAQDHAHTLLLDRARSALADIAPAEHSVLDAVTHRLDGLPLAIELAASRLSTLSLTQLHDRLADPRRLLGGPNADRHGTLEAALQWSWDLLDPAARTLLAMLSVFRGGFDLEAVEEISQDPDAIDVLLRLRERSLVRRHDDPRLPGDPRFDLLDSVRTFAARHLDGTDVVARHATWFAAESARLVRGLRTPTRRVCLARLRRDRANLEAAWERAEPATRCKIALGLDVLLAIDGPPGQRGRVLDASLAVAPSPLDRALLLLRRADFHIDTRQRRPAIADVDDAIPLLGSDPDPELLAQALYVRADAMTWTPDTYPWLHRTIALLPPDHWLTAECWSLLSGSLGAQGRLPEAERAGQSARRGHRAAGDALGEALALGRLGLVAWDAGRGDEARERLQEARELLREVESPDTTYKFLGRYVGTIANLALDGAWALAIYAEKRDLAGRLGNLVEVAISTLQMGQACVLLARWDDAIAHAERACALLPSDAATYHHGAHRLFLAEALIAADRIPEATRALRDAADLLGEGSLDQPLALDQGTVKLLAGHAQEALVALERARNGPMSDLAAVATAFSAIATARRGDPEGARALFDRANEHPTVRRLSPWFVPAVIGSGAPEPTSERLLAPGHIECTGWNAGAVSGDDFVRYALVAWRLSNRP